MSSVPPQLAHFKRLSTSVWHHAPATTSPSFQEPTLILLIGWMGATPRYISKYTSAYEKLHPSSSILAITTTAFDAILWSEAATLHRIEPVLDILCSLDANATLLLHSFSDGGSFTTTRIAGAYRERMRHRLPVTAMILDSSPGKATYHDTVRAFAVSLPSNPIIQVVAGILLRFGWGLFVFGYKVQGKENMVENNRELLNDKELFDPQVKRLYFYSTKDDMVFWELVEEHAKEAEDKGWDVSMEKYVESGHCSHMISDAERYWGAVQRIWNRSV